VSEPTQLTKSMMASDPATTPVREWLAWCAELVSLGGDRYGRAVWSRSAVRSAGSSISKWVTRRSTRSRRMQAMTDRGREIERRDGE